MPKGIFGAIESASKGNGLQDELVLGQGDRALIRPLGSGDENDGLFAVCGFHTQGNGTNFRDLGICRKEYGEECPACEKNAQRRNQLAVWVWVHCIYHPQQKMPDWEKVEVRGRGFAFKETVNKPKVLKKGLGKGRSFLETWVNYFHEYGGLNTCDYLVSRTGEGFDTVYSVTPRPSTAMSEDMQKAAREAPDITEYYKNQVLMQAPVSTDENTIPLDDDEEAPF